MVMTTQEQIHLRIPRSRSMGYFQVFFQTHMRESYNNIAPFVVPQETRDTLGNLHRIRDMRWW
jgi:hypothetical protein